MKGNQYQTLSHLLVASGVEVVDCVCTVYPFIYTHCSEGRGKYPASNLRKRDPFYPTSHPSWNNRELFLVGGTIAYTTGNQVITSRCIFISVNTS